jgi:ubiquitin C-terminal hydrolase
MHYARVFIVFSSFACFRYYLVLLSAGIIGFSDFDFADSHDNFIDSMLNRFESQNRFENQQLCLHGFNAALASTAVSIIRYNFMTEPAMFLESFAEIPSARRKSIIRLLLSASSCPNLLQLNDLILQLSLFLHQIFDVSLSSYHQSDVLLGIVDFVTQDVCVLSPTISLYWLHLFFKSRFSSRDENTSVKSLLEAAVRVSSCIHELVGIAKRNKNVYESKLSILFAVQTFILRLLLPTEIESHPTLASEVTRHFCAIFECAAFPQDTMSLMTDASPDIRMNVLLPRPFSADLMRPLCSKVDSVCIELCQLVQEALLRFCDLSAAVFHTLIQRSESMLVFKNLSLTTTSSSFASFHGIINLGCTCYFNSITQQLFMIPGFAASVIAAQVKIDAVSQSATAESNSPARCILEDFQDLMINLRHGSDPVVHPKTFCDSFRFPDGSCILPDVQQDALEYFHILCDHLDNALKGSHDEKLLSRFFGGRSATQLLCKGCPHRYERFEHFFTLQLAVFSNRANSVLGALQEFVAGELLEGDNQYFCSQCNKKVDTVKRTVLADLPDTIILGLKRFDFNYDTMQRVKLNLEVPFSHDLDMSPFCRENLGETPADSEPAIIREPGYYQYSLAGIVVHSGMADSGHYFSIIRDPMQTGLWHKFNDDEVTHIQNLDLKQFYGGLTGKFAHTNAYILVYNRKVPLFNHEYEKILSIESAVEQVQCTGKLSMSTMFVNSLGMEQLWQCFSLSMHNLFATSDDPQHELAYLDFVLKLNHCVEFQDLNAVELFMQPLVQSLRSTKKCYAILEQFILKVCEMSSFQTLWFHPIADSNLKGNPTLQPLFTDLLSKVVSSMNECDCSRLTPDEMAVYRNILRVILHFFGHLSFQLFVHFPQENSSEFEPITAALSFAVQKYLQQALTQGLALGISKFLSLELPSFDDVGFTALVDMCTTAAYFAHLSENGSKLRSKRRSHLRNFVVDSRYRACWNCLVLMKTCFLEQPSVLVQEMLKNGMWFKCFEKLFMPSFFEKYIYTFTSAPPFHIQIVAMFYELSSKLLPMVRSIFMHVAFSS